MSLKLSRSQKMGYLFGVLLSPIFAIFAYFDQPERGFIFMCLAGVFVTVIYVRRDVVTRMYFIFVVTSAFVIELILVSLLNIPTKHFPGIIMMPLAIANTILILAILRLVEKKLNSRRG